MFVSQVLFKIKHLFFILNKVQEKVQILFLTFECPYYQLLPCKTPHRRHHLHLPQFLVLENIF